MVQSRVLPPLSGGWQGSTLERQSKCFAASEHPSADGSDGHVEAGRNFAIAEPFEMEREEHLPLLRGQGGEGLAQLLHALAFGSFGLWARLVTGQKLDGVVFPVSLYGGASPSPSPVLRSQGVERHVARDAEHPWQEVSVVLPAILLFHDPAEGFVRAVLNIGIVFRPPQNASDQGFHLRSTFGQSIHGRT